VAGHSKWANIQHRKGRQDEKRGKVWTRVIREIMVAARLGGGDLSANPRLRLAVEKAKAANLPIDTVKRNIDKATGNLEGVHLRRNPLRGLRHRRRGHHRGHHDRQQGAHRGRCAPRVQQVRRQHGHGEGSVAFQFKHCGQMIFAPGTNEDKLMEVALEAGAEDVITGDDGAIEVLTAYPDFEAVKNALEAAGLKPEVAEVTMRPENTIALSGEDAAKMQKLLDMMEDLDDVQECLSQRRDL
jgi:transcriptional/translational regulatory protein YebC/TACO1